MQILQNAGLALFLVSVGLTLLSGINYVVKNKQLFSSKVKKEDTETQNSEVEKEGK